MNKTKALEKSEGEDSGVEVQSGGVSGSQDGSEYIQDIHSELAELDWSLAKQCGDVVGAARSGSG
jgi:hypothetical protein